MESITHLDLSTDHPEWNESYYFVFYDKENNLGGMTRLGFKPNKLEGMTFFFLFLPNGSAAGYFREKTVKDYNKTLKVGGVSHVYQNNSKWKYLFQGKMIFVKNPEDLPKVREEPGLISTTKKVLIDISFNPINDTYEYSDYMTPESLKIGKKAGDKHWEQIGILFGNIQIGNDNYVIKDVLGQRDHTYGVRDWTNVGNWLYYVVWFDKTLAINPAAIITDDGSMSTGGFLFKDGENIPLRTIEIVDQRYRKDGVFPISSELKIIDKLNNKHILKAKVGSIIPVPFIDSEGNSSILVQSMGKFELNGRKGGYGSFETLRKVK
ncbi:MAG: hypothetical protein ACFE9I_10835 [Candidatus Hermodarchaeota archaeon]